MSTSFGNPAMPTTQPHLWIDGKLVCQKFRTMLVYTMSFPSYGTYLKKKHQWTQGDLKQVHWPVLKRTLHSFKHNNQRQLILFINDKLPLCASKAHPHHGSLLCPSCQQETKITGIFLNAPSRNARSCFQSVESTPVN